MSGESPLDWSAIYARLARRPERPDPLAWAELERRVRAWTDDDEVAAATCAEVWRTFNLARGGASFEGFVHGRFIEVATSPPGGRKPCAPTVGAQGLRPPVSAGQSTDGDGRGERLTKCLEELGGRNPRHHAAIVLLYEDRATVPEAADALVVDEWTIRALAARARQALAQCLDRAARTRQTQGRAGGRPGRPGGKPPGRRRRG